MLWSRVAQLNGPGRGAKDQAYRVPNLGNFVEGADDAVWLYASQEQLHMEYTISNVTVMSTRPALARSGWLYFVCAVQALLLLAALALSLSLASVPEGRHFHLMIAVLSNVEPSTFAPLQGASLSGELAQKAHLAISVEE